jgi:hypothetical protein
MFLTEKIRNEREHARGIEKHRRIILRNEWRRLDHGMLFGAEKLEKFGSDFGGEHEEKMKK